MRRMVKQARLCGPTGLRWNIRPANNRDFENTHRRVMYDNVVNEGVKALMDGFFVEAEGVFSETAENRSRSKKRAHNLR